FEAENPRIVNRINVVVNKKGGSAIPFVTAGVIALIAGLILNAKSKTPLSRGFGNYDRSY
ncbi:MAG: hypothetical protein ACE5FY_07780, partial [Nitrospiria bacterium]